MMDIVEFLTARLAADEAAVEAATAGPVEERCASGADFGPALNRLLFHQSFNPARVLAEVAAKRDRLALYVEVTDILFHGGTGDRIKYQRESGRFEALDVEVRRDAALYAEHADYKQEWGVE